MRRNKYKILLFGFGLLILFIINFIDIDSDKVFAAGGNNFDNASEITKLNKQTKDTITTENGNRYYKIQLKSNGILTIKLKSSISDIYLRIYNASRYILNDKYVLYDREHNSYNTTWSQYLESGTYYVSVNSQLLGSAGTFYYTVAFDKSKSNDKEPNNQNDNAQEIVLNKDYTGLISLTDRKDIYTINVPEDTTLSFTLNSKIKENVNIRVEKEDGQFTDWGSAKYDPLTDKNSSYTYSKDITKGKYYIVVDSQDGSESGVYTIKTKCNISITAMIASEGKKTVCVGDKFTIYPIVAPAFANEVVTYASSNKAIATVTSKGVIKTHKTGKVTITLTANKNHVLANSIITVKNVSVKKVKLDKTSITLKKGGSVTLKATVSPSNASNKKIIWSSNKKSVATVNSKGKVIVAGTGTCTITAKSQSGGKLAKCKIIVKAPVVVTPKPVVTETPSNTDIPSIPVSSVNVESSISLEVKASQRLHAVCAPQNATNKKITWSSSNSKVVSVNSSGKITGVSKGSAVITVKSTNGKKAYCTVMVR